MTYIGPAQRRRVAEYLMEHRETILGLIREADVFGDGASAGAIAQSLGADPGFMAQVLQAMVRDGVGSVERSRMRKHERNGSDNYRYHLRAAEVVK